uniref:Uncharacterized protein n=1 Tax=Kwoniella dejecticola CBS 10117 TaxID=1296121 RepID=A0A1A6A579_9TREE|nr:uncharacterized protein I303_04555 [Kwoniella dejecticola CBS 10117]OBR85222.1 hypothetical protein I303_04555 [Kwoniella dejecticola CBS 10117]
MHQSRSPIRIIPSLLLLPTIWGVAIAQEISCSTANTRPDPCSIPSPGGLFVFRQRFEPDVGSDSGSWGIDGLEVLDCATQQPQDRISYGPTYTHEEIGSYCAKSPLFGGEKGYNDAEKEWAQSEVGEGVEEVWERTWNTAGRFISTFDYKCLTKPQAGVGVAEFFTVLSKLQRTFTTARLLSDADITPSDDTTYSLRELTEALSTGDYKPIVQCDNTTLSSVSWPLNVKGKFDSGSFEAASNYEKKYPPSTTLAPTKKNDDDEEWKHLRRPPPRPITLSHDESRMYYRKEAAKEDPVVKLGLRKEHDEERDEWKEERAGKQYWRDEL